MPDYKVVELRIDHWRYGSQTIVRMSRLVGGLDSYERSSAVDMPLRLDEA